VIGREAKYAEHRRKVASERHYALWDMVWLRQSMVNGTLRG